MSQSYQVHGPNQNTSYRLRTAGLHCAVRAGGLGELAYPLVSDLKREISEAYGVLSGMHRFTAVLWAGQRTAQLLFMAAHA